MTDKIRTVRLYGKLGTKFGRTYKLAVGSASEAVRALSAMIPGFESHITNSQDRGVGYAVFIGKQNVSMEQLGDPVGNDDIRIAPVMTGSKKGGIFQIVLGVALIATAFMTGGASLTFMGMFTAGGMTGTLAMAGLSMVLGGVAQLLTPTPKGLSAKDGPENTPSNSFNGPVNTQAQGACVPVLYGRLIVGSAVISAGIRIEDAYVPTNGGSGWGGDGGDGGGGSAYWRRNWAEESMP